jgi:hypothetical protein
MDFWASAARHNAAFPDGAQRNWVYLVSDAMALDADALARLELLAQRFQEVVQIVLIFFSFLLKALVSHFSG